MFKYLFFIIFLTYFANANANFDSNVSDYLSLGMSEIDYNLAMAISANLVGFSFMFINLLILTFIARK